jgi:hypothetical protein
VAAALRQGNYVLLRLLIVCFLLGGFAVAFGQVAKETQSFTPQSPCADGTSDCMAPR